jgi:caspase 3
MSHGKESGCVAAADGLIELREIWNKFKGHESLMGKPKLFFVQACRGTKVAKGVEIPNQLVPDAQNNTISIPEFADNLIMFSTDDETISIRESNKGTWFIQELCKQLKNNTSSDLMSILTVVTRKVALMNGVIEINGEQVPAKQLPIIMSSLTKKIYFQGQKLTSDSLSPAVLPDEIKAKSGFPTNILPFVAFVAFALFSLTRN